MRLEYGGTPNNKVPEGWKVVELQNLVRDAKNGFATGKRNNNGIVQIRMNNVTRDGYLIFDSYLKVPIPESIDEWLLKEGDLLFNNTNSIDLVGKSAIFKEAPFPCTFSNHFTRIRFREDLVLPELILYHFIILWEKRFFRSVAIRHVGQAAVHTKYLFKLKIILPPLREQQRIIEILSTVDNAIQKVDESTTKTERLKNALIQELLTKGVILGFMLDTTVLNDVLNKKIDINKFSEDFDYFLTHFQQDELDETPDPDSRERLRQIFTDLGKEEIPTGSFVFDISGFNRAKSGDSEIFDGLRKENLRHTEDALVGETAIKNGLTLITDDKRLLEKVRNLGGWAITLRDFLNGNYREFRNTEIGRIPRNWRVVRLKDVGVKFIGGGTPSTTMQEYWNGKIPWMTSAHITGRLITDGQRYITEKGLMESTTNLVPKGNVLVATRVGIGKVALNRIDIAISQDLTGVIIDENKVISEYIYWALAKETHELKKLGQGSTIKGILRERLKRIMLPLPSLPEQRRIAKILSTVDRKLNLETKRKEKLERIKKGLMNDLLTGKKRVKI